MLDIPLPNALHHRRHAIIACGGHQQMKVVGYQHIRVHSNRFLRSHRDQMIQEKLAISILEKHRSLVDPAQDHMRIG